MADFGFLPLVLWEIILMALAALVILKGWKGMVLSWGLLVIGCVLTMDRNIPWLMLGTILGVLLMGLSLEFLIKQKSDVQGFLHLETGVVGMFFLMALGWALLPVALLAGALCGGLILRRYMSVPGLKGWVLFLLGERLVFSVVWLVLGNLI
ncbi:MAG: hypothetical protein FWG40_01760 [Peptococcaceae bacterium]|nr:hypothetical protein [Peptococcaceae bacterium]